MIIDLLIAFSVVSFDCVYVLPTLLIYIIFIKMQRFRYSQVSYEVDFNLYIFNFLIYL